MERFMTQGWIDLERKHHFATHPCSCTSFSPHPSLKGCVRSENSWQVHSPSQFSVRCNCLSTSCMNYPSPLRIYDTVLDFHYLGLCNAWCTAVGVAERGPLVANRSDDRRYGTAYNGGCFMGLQHSLLLCNKTAVIQYVNITSIRCKWEFLSHWKIMILN